MTETLSVISPSSKVIDKIVAEMPKVKNPYKCYCDTYSPHTKTRGQVARDANYHGFEEGSDARAKLLAEQGWRKVPSEEEFEQKFCELVTRPSVNDLAHRTGQAILDLHHCLSGGE